MKHLRLALIPLCLLLIATVWDVKTPDLSLRDASAQRFQVLDRHGQPLGISYQTRFNTMDITPLHNMPELLRHAFVTSEDRNFFTHHGVDWKARLSALRQNILARKSVRGASTITEQVVRIVHPRPRNLWSRWVEGFEAMLLERRASKGEILEFYLNQVPYAANRRGVAQAARYYFNRDLDTLTKKEMLALAVLPRAPTALDLYKNPGSIEQALTRLSEAMQARGELSEKINDQPLTLEPASPLPSAMHFIQYIRETIPYQLSRQGQLSTTLDAALQQKAQTLLDERIQGLKRKRVTNGAALVVDHTTGEILTWAVAGMEAQTPGHAIDAVRAPRQPGSSTKPFLYALALDSGWSAATILDDAPMAEAIGSGLHDFHNYSHTFYGKISLREALGNSLNIPALQTIAFVTPPRFLNTLHALGFESLTQPAEFYNDGLALGNGEVSLFEMVQAYSALANRGIFRPLTPLLESTRSRESTRVYSEEAASLIAHILSDPFARRREFGADSVLNLPVQTAVKTGTSTDYRDAWVLGFNSRYTVGVWLGNLDQTPMDGITGSIGPALVLRGIFSDLNQRERPKPLRLSPKLAAQEICTGEEGKSCFPRTEYFIPGTEPKEAPPPPTPPLKIIRPTPGLQLAYDPRIPAESQAFEFTASGEVEWVLNGKVLNAAPSSRFLWPVERGKYELVARQASASETVRFQVK